MSEMGANMKPKWLCVHCWQFREFSAHHAHWLTCIPRLGATETIFVVAGDLKVGNRPGFHAVDTGDWRLPEEFHSLTFKADTEVAA